MAAEIKGPGIYPHKRRIAMPLANQAGTISADRFAALYFTFTDFDNHEARLNRRLLF